MKACRSGLQKRVSDIFTGAVLPEASRDAGPARRSSDPDVRRKDAVGPRTPVGRPRRDRSVRSNGKGKGPGARGSNPTPIEST